MADSGQVDTPKAIDFTDVRAAAGLPAATRECMAVRDFDGDGAPDLLLSPLSADEQSVSLALFRNRGDGTFDRVDVATTAKQFGACAAADVDGDGHVDAAFLDGDTGALVILHAKGTTPPSFEERPVDPSLVPPDPERFTVAFLDVDADGWPDVYTATSAFGSIKTTSCDVTANDVQCQMSAAPDAGRPLLLRNDAGNGFVRSALDLPAPRASVQWSLSTVDWNDDGAVDLFLSDDYSRNQLLLNRGTSFEDVLPGLGANVYNHGMGAAFGDFNRDGAWDFYVADIGPDQVWISDGAGGVGDHSVPWGVADVTRSHYGWGPLAADFDDDGFDDVFVGNGMVTPTMQGIADVTTQGLDKLDTDCTDSIFLNDRGKGFVHEPLPFPTHGRSHVRSVAADFDGDGFVDVLEGPVPLRLLHNGAKATTSAHWLGVSLVGAHGATNAHGAVVTVEAAGGEWGRRAADAHDGFGNSSETLHFGLARLTEVTALHVTWPGGLRQDVPGPIVADQVVRVVRP